MAREDLTLQGSGVVGNNQAADTAVAIINAPGPGRYKIWGTGRHSLVDGLKLTSPTVPAVILSGGAGDTINFGPIVFDITNNTSGIIVALNTATGAADTASATVYAQRLSK